MTSKSRCTVYFLTYVATLSACRHLDSEYQSFSFRICQLSTRSPALRTTVAAASRGPFPFQKEIQQHGEKKRLGNKYRFQRKHFPLLVVSTVPNESPEGSIPETGLGNREGAPHCTYRLL